MVVRYGKPEEKVIFINNAGLWPTHENKHRDHAQFPFHPGARIKRPDLFYAYIGHSQIVDPSTGMLDAYHDVTEMGERRYMQISTADCSFQLVNFITFRH